MLLLTKKYIREAHVALWEVDNRMTNDTPKLIGFPQNGISSE